MWLWSPCFYYIALLLPGVSSDGMESIHIVLTKLKSRLDDGLFPPPTPVYCFVVNRTSLMFIL